MDDLINRQAAIDAVRDRMGKGETHIGDTFIECFEMILNALPSAQPYTDEEIQKMQDLEQAQFDKMYELGQQDAQPEPQWIPVTERLPEGIGQVIIQTNGDAIHEVFYKGKNDYGHEVWMRLDGGIYWDDEVVAWMPLPDPYKEGDNERA